jgi:hypothetical protein
VISVAYKGVTLFNDFDNDGGSFIAWEKLPLGALEKYFAQMHNLLINSSQELGADIRNIAKGDTDVETAERAKLISSDQNGLEHLLLFVGDPLRCQLLRFNRAREAWRYLHEQYQLWKQSRGPLLQQQLENFGPILGEGVGAFCRRAQQLQAMLSQTGRPYTDAMMIDVVLRGL